MPDSHDLDFEQVITNVYDLSTNRLRTDANVSGGGSGSQEVIISHIDDSIRLGDGTKLVTATQSGSKVGIDVQVLNQITASFSGLQNGLKITKLIVTDTPVAVPETALSGRNSISVRVWGANTVFFGDSNVTADEGYPKLYGEEIFMDIKDNNAVLLYAVCNPGQTSELRIFELA